MPRQTQFQSANVTLSHLLVQYHPGLTLEVSVTTGLELISALQPDCPNMGNPKRLIAHWQVVNAPRDLRYDCQASLRCRQIV